MWGLRFPACHWVFINRYWVFVFPSAFWFMVSWDLFIIPFGVGVCVSFVFLFSMVLVVSFQPPFALLFITFVVMLLGCLISLFSMFIPFWVVIVAMSSSPDSAYKGPIGIDCDTMSILRIMFSCIWFIVLFSFLFSFHVSPPYMIIGCIHVFISFHEVSICRLLKCWLPRIVMMVWYAASVFLFISGTSMWFSILPLWFRVSPRYLYVFVYSNFMFPRYISGFCCPLPILRILLFASLNSMWYLLAISRAMT